MARRIPKDAMTRALAQAGDEDLVGEDEDLPLADEDAVPSPDDLPDPNDPDAAAIPDKLYFRIGEVASLVGVDAHVLRYWESEFRMRPHRSSSGQRLYRKQDLARFFRIKRLLHDEGYTIAGARRVLTGGSGQVQAVDVARIKEAMHKIQDPRSRILELRDEMDPQGRA